MMYGIQPDQFQRHLMLQGLYRPYVKLYANSHTILNVRRYVGYLDEKRRRLWFVKRRGRLVRAVENQMYITHLTNFLLLVHRHEMLPDGAIVAINPEAFRTALSGIHRPNAWPTPKEYRDAQV